jgi:hypothetical protein
MAVTSLSQAINDWWKSTRPGVNVDPSATLRSGLVSDLAVGDFLVGARAVITATGNTSGNPAVRALTLQRRGELNYDVSWPAAATVWFTRV